MRPLLVTETAIASTGLPPAEIYLAAIRALIAATGQDTSPHVAAIQGAVNAYTERLHAAWDAAAAQRTAPASVQR